MIQLEEITSKHSLCFIIFLTSEKEKSISEREGTIISFCRIISWNEKKKKSNQEEQV